MRKIELQEIKPGMVTKKAVFTEEGRILITSGTELRESYIEKLRSHGIKYLYIDENQPVENEVDDVICENIRQETKQLVKNIMISYERTSRINIERVKDMIEKIIDDLLSGKYILKNLADIKSVDDYTFEHSVNVCVLSLITGIGYGYNTVRLKDLGVGALLHDIGKLHIPESILKKPSQLTVEEFEEIKKHTIYGYEILKNNKNVSMISAFIAFGHHERYDGSGYPLQLRGENIHQCAKIVAVADVYDALTSNRVYRQKLKYHEVIEYITSLRTQHFDREIVNGFIKFIALYPVGTNVILNTNHRGIVVRVNGNAPTRPVVKITCDEQGRKIECVYEIDLMEEQNMYVLEQCDF